MNAAADPISIAGVVPRSTVTPRSIDDLRKIVAAAAADGDAVALVGGGTELGLGAAPERLDVAVRMTSLSQIVEYDPADLVVTAEAGVTLAELQTVLAPHKQRLALDPPRAERATLGGLLATNAFGPLRTRFGTLRDSLVGISLVRADGKLVRGGGKVVKNVAGFDLPKISIGSLGTLAAIATATLRLQPLPEVTRRIRVRAADATALRSFAERLIEAQLEPAALVAERSSDGAYECDAVFEGFARGAHMQLVRATSLALSLGNETQEIDPGSLDAEGRSRDEAVRLSGNLRLRLAFPPASLAAADRSAIEVVRAALEGARVSLYPSAGIAFVSGDVVAGDGASLLAALESARSALAALGGHAVVTEMPVDVRARISPWGPAPASLELMRRLKDRFDPKRTFNPGRFVGGI